MPSTHYTPNDMIRYVHAKLDATHHFGGECLTTPGFFGDLWGLVEFAGKLLVKIRQLAEKEVVLMLGSMYLAVCQ